MYIDNCNETRMLMPTLLNFLSCWLCFHYLFPISEAIDFQFDSATSVRYSSYVEHQFSYLEVPKQTETRVRVFADCAMGCLMKSPPCLSVNMASTSDRDGMFWCELLLADMYNNSQSFKENNSTSHHYSIWVSWMVMLSWLVFVLCSEFYSKHKIVNCNLFTYVTTKPSS